MTIKFFHKIIGYDLHRDESNSFELGHSTDYFTDLITDEAEKIIRKNNNAKPLFLEISHLAVHAGGKVNDDPLEVRRTDDVNASFPYIEDYQRRKYAGKNDKRCLLGFIGLYKYSMCTF